jgi:CubicO group peptidase (beta-lactamase class C family)
MSGRELQSLLDDARAKHRVVGATLGILKDGAIETYASGLLNSSTRVECTTDSVFQIGSISKVFTATLIMQLVDQGRVNLDDPVVKYLADFTLADPVAARAVTVKQLLNHTSGMDGDFFPADDPEGPSTVSYVRKMCLLTNLYPPGEGPMTYSNSGFGVAGRIIEVLTGKMWQQVVMESICRPLEMPQAFASPHESLRYRCAMGHVPDPQDSTRTILAETTYLPLSMASIGSVLSMSAESLLLFAKAHVSDGSAILNAESTRRMREDRIPVPLFTRYGVTHRGLGWSVGDALGYYMVGHDGGTRGHYSYLRVFPKQKAAITMLLNSPGEKLFREIEEHLMQPLVGASIPPEPAREPFEVQFDRYVGRYGNVAVDYEVSREGDTLRLHYKTRVGVTQEFNALLEPYRRDTFEIRAPQSLFDGQKISFLEELEDGRALYIRMGSRMARIQP